MIKCSECKYLDEDEYGYDCENIACYRVEEIDALPSDKALYGRQTRKTYTRVINYSDKNISNDCPDFERKKWWRRIF